MTILTQEQWTAIRDCDRAYDEVFVYAVKTTGIVCRPSCRARACKPENVVIFDTVADAIAEGYRPCRRCCPEIKNWAGTKAELARKLRSWIEDHYTEKFSLETIAEAQHMDKNYLLRVFKEVNGTTMLHYHNRVRCEHASQLLTQSDLSVSGVGEAVGYKTASHFTRIYKQVTGSTPIEYRKRFLSETRQTGRR